MPNNRPRRQKISRSLREAVFRTQGRVCWLCGKPGADTVDHVRPVSHGGNNILSNCKPAHRRCNSARQAPHPVAGVGYRTQPAGGRR